MPLFKKYCLLILILVVVSNLSGCALLNVPGQLIGGTFNLLGKILGIVQKLPKPPPGVFF